MENIRDWFQNVIFINLNGIKFACSLFFFLPKGKIQCFFIFFLVLTSRSFITDYGVNIS